MAFKAVGGAPGSGAFDDLDAVLFQQVYRALDTASPTEADVRRSFGGAARHQPDAVPKLVDAEQRAANGDLADQRFPVRLIFGTHLDAEQPIVKGAGRLQVADRDRNVIDAQDARHSNLHIVARPIDHPMATDQ